jgi:hypothetical protein
VTYRYCPECRCEYRPGFDTCSDCGVALVDHLLPEPEEEAHESGGLGVTATAVWSGGQGFEAEAIRSMLEANGIGAEVWSAGIGTNTGFDALAAHRVMVKAEDADEARTLL